MPSRRQQSRWLACGGSIRRSLRLAEGRIDRLVRQLRGTAAFASSLACASVAAGHARRRELAELVAHHVFGHVTPG